MSILCYNIEDSEILFISEENFNLLCEDTENKYVLIEPYSGELKETFNISFKYSSLMEKKYKIEIIENEENHLEDLDSLNDDGYYSDDGYEDEDFYKGTYTGYKKYSENIYYYYVGRYIREELHYIKNVPVKYKCSLW